MRLHRCSLRCGPCGPSCGYDVKAWPFPVEVSEYERHHHDPRQRITGKKRFAHCVQETLDAQDSRFLQDLSGNAFSAQCCLFSMCTLGTVLGWLMQQSRQCADSTAAASPPSPSSSSRTAAMGTRMQRSLSKLLVDVSDSGTDGSVSESDVSVVSYLG